MPDYYAILGVPRDANTDEIRRAYRRLARESHPDANPGDPHAEERFKQIGEAYEVLSDPGKRERYDTFGDPNAASGGFGGLGDIMEAFFGSPFGAARTRAPTSAVGGSDLVTDATLTLEESVFGAKRQIEMAARVRCERCTGEGSEPGTYRARCGRCAGQGEVRSTRQTILGTVMTARPCPACGGAGEAPSSPCERCKGRGRVNGLRSVTVEVPAGVRDGMTLRISAQGEAGVRGGRDGDLYVRIHIEPHRLFEQDGDDLVCALRIPLSTAVLGGTGTVPTLDGEVPITIAAGTQHGTVIRLRGHGAARTSPRGRGDLLVGIEVEIPVARNAEERALFERLAELRGEEVRGRGKGILGRLRETFGG